MNDLCIFLLLPSFTQFRALGRDVSCMTLIDDYMCRYRRGIPVNSNSIIPISLVILSLSFIPNPILSLMVYSCVSIQQEVSIREILNVLHSNPKIDECAIAPIHKTLKRIFSSSLSTLRNTVKRWICRVSRYISFHKLENLLLMSALNIPTQRGGQIIFMNVIISYRQ